MYKSKQMFWEHKALEKKEIIRYIIIERKLFCRSLKERTHLIDLQL